MNRTKVILSIFLMLFLLLAGLVLPSFWKSQKKEASGNKGRNRQRKQQKQILIPPCRNIWILML